jgi:hypothetical protein
MLDKAEPKAPLPLPKALPKPLDVFATKPPKGEALLLAPPKVNLGASGDEAAGAGAGEAKEDSDGPAAAPKPLPLVLPNAAKGEDAEDSCPNPEAANALADVCTSFFVGELPVGICFESATVVV